MYHTHTSAGRAADGSRHISDKRKGLGVRITARRYCFGMSAYRDSTVVRNAPLCRCFYSFLTATQLVLWSVWTINEQKRPRCAKQTAVCSSSEWKTREAHFVCLARAGRNWWHNGRPEWPPSTANRLWLKTIRRWNPKHAVLRSAWDPSNTWCCRPPRQCRADTG